MPRAVHVRPADPPAPNPGASARHPAVCTRTARRSAWPGGPGGRSCETHLSPAAEAVNTYTSRRDQPAVGPRLMVSTSAEACPSPATRSRPSSAPSADTSATRHGAMRVPRRAQELSSRVRAAMGELTQRQGHHPSSAELADHLEVSVQEISRLSPHRRPTVWRPGMRPTAAPMTTGPSSHASAGTMPAAARPDFNRRGAPRTAQKPATPSLMRVRPGCECEGSGQDHRRWGKVCVAPG